MRYPRGAAAADCAPPLTARRGRFTSAEAAAELEALRTELAALESALHIEGLDLLRCEGKPGVTRATSLLTTVGAMCVWGDCRLAPAEQLLPESEAMQAVNAQQVRLLCRYDDETPQISHILAMATCIVCLKRCTIPLQRAP